jgi:hypothetical protein
MTIVLSDYGNQMAGKIKQRFSQRTLQNLAGNLAKNLRTLF